MVNSMVTRPFRPRGYEPQAIASFALCFVLLVCDRTHGEGGWLERAANQAHLVENDSTWQHHVYAEIARLHIRRGELAEAEQIVRRIEALDIQEQDQVAPIAQPALLRRDILAARVVELLQADDADGALAVADSDPDHRDYALMELSLAHAEAGRARDAVATAHRMEWRGGWNRIAQALAKAGAVDEAEQLADAIENDTWKRSTLEAIGVARARRGELELARQIADGLRIPNSAAVNTEIIAVLAARGDIDEALELARAHNERAGRHWTLDPYLIIARGHLEAGNLDAAVQAAQQVELPQARQQAWTAVLNAHIEAGRLNQAFQVTQDQVPAASRLECYRLLFKAFAKAGESEAAMGHIEQIEPAGFRSAAHEALVRGQLAAGNLDAALATFDRLRGPGADELLPPPMRGIHELERDVADDLVAELLRRRDFRRASEIEGGNQIVVAIVAAMHGEEELARQIEAQLRPLVEWFRQDLAAAWMLPYLWHLLDERELFDQWVGELRDTAYLRVQGDWQRGWAAQDARAALLNLAVMTGDLIGAQEYAERLPAIFLMGALSHGGPLLAESGRLDELIPMMDLIRDHSDRIAVWRDLISAAVSNRRDRELDQFVQELPSPRHRAEVLVAMARVREMLKQREN